MAERQIASGNEKLKQRPRVKVTARAIVVHRDHVLLIRAEDPRRVWYFLPGGLVEYSERLEDACARELKEETGLDVYVLRPLFLREFIAKRHERRSVHMPERHHVLATLFLCQLTDADKDKPFSDLGAFTPDKGATGVRGLEWKSFKEIADIEIMPPHLKHALSSKFPPPKEAGIQFWPED